jgi:hypothetical protein
MVGRKEGEVPTVVRLKMPKCMWILQGGAFALKRRLVCPLQQQRAGSRGVSLCLCAYRAAGWEEEWPPPQSNPQLLRRLRKTAVTKATLTAGHLTTPSS